MSAAAMFILGLGAVACWWIDQRVGSALLAIGSVAFALALLRGKQERQP